ncbi:MAG: HAD family hydrolase, partial [Lentisphaerae bacterium]
TLYPEVDYVFSGFRHAAELVVEAYSISIEPVLRQLFNEGVRHNIFLRAMQKLGLPADEYLIKKMVTAYRHAPSPLQPYSDFSLLCEFARRHQLSMAIHTDGIPSVQHMKIRRLGICSAFRHILCTDDLGGPAFRKPHPTSYHALLHNMGVSPKETLLIADNPLKDFVTPRALGIRCVRIRRPDGLYASQEPTTTEFLPHAEITGFHQLNELSDLTFLSS